MSGVGIDIVLCRGGVDQITPTQSLANSYARYALNFEAAVTGGYTRITGYERFDGQQSPTDAADSTIIQFVTLGVAGPAVGTTVWNVASFDTPTAGGFVVYSQGSTVGIALTNGAFVVGDHFYKVPMNTSYGNVLSLVTSPLTADELAAVKLYISATYRTSITAVPGSGPIRGVVEFNDVVYAFRDNSLATACNIYESTAAGWNLVPFLNTISFTAGKTEPFDGDTLLQGGVTAVIKRVVRTGGSWQNGDAVGQLILATPAGGNFIAGAATVPARTPDTTLTLSGAQTAITLLPGGRFEFEEHNFAGQSASNRIYGCDRVNTAFEFDGEILAPIKTAATVDTPTHIACHKGYLFLALGSSILHSAPGLPYDWTGLSGAGELATGATVTGMISMPGGTNTATLGVANRSNFLILYGSSPADWNLTSYNTGTGAIPYSMQNMSQTYAFDDRGVNAITTALQYGNFNSTTLTSAVLPFINSKINLLNATVLCRRKSQYRLFFSDGFGMYITVANNKLLGCMPVYFPDVVCCTYEGKKSTGQDIMYFGSDNGMVYQMDKGTSFDGAEIEFNLVMNFSNSKGPRTLKRYRKCVPEITSLEGPYAKFNLSYMLGYGSGNYEQPIDISYSKVIGSPQWDQFTWDKLFWDSKSIDFLECGMDGTAENVAILISGAFSDVPEFTINSFTIHYSPRRLMR